MSAADGATAPQGSTAPHGSTAPRGATIRTATLDDLDEIMAIETSVFVSDAWSRKSMAHEITDPSNRYLVAVDTAGGHVVGYSGVLAHQGAPDSDIQNIAVAPDARRRGIARALVQTMLVFARERGARETFLEVRVDNPAAQTLYESFGFEGIAVRPKYYMPDGVDALVMRLDLRAALSKPGGTL